MRTSLFALLVSSALFTGVTIGYTLEKGKPIVRIKQSSAKAKADDGESTKCKTCTTNADCTGGAPCGSTCIQSIVPDYKYCG